MLGLSLLPLLFQFVFLSIYNFANNFVVEFFIAAYYKSDLRHSVVCYILILHIVDDPLGLYNSFKWNNHDF